MLRRSARDAPALEPNRASYNTDISNFWEFSATGFKSIDESNEAYKLGVDDIMYGLTH